MQVRKTQVRICNGGKHRLSTDLIQHKYRNKFDYIVILCPTFINNKTYNRPFIYRDSSIIPVPINDKLNSVLQEISNKFSDPKEHTLILLDDCANLHDAKMKSTALTKLAFHGRHSNISCWEKYTGGLRTLFLPYPQFLTKFCNLQLKSIYFK